MTMKKLLLIFFIIPLTLKAQVNLDSLWGIWNDTSQPDTVRFRTMSDLSWDGYLFSDPDSSYLLAGMLYNQAKSKGLKRYMATALNIQGVSFWVKGQMDSAATYLKKYLSIHKELGNKQGVANAYNNIALVYKQMGDQKNAIEYNYKSLKTRKEMNDKPNIAACYNNIGIIYADQRKSEIAMKYYNKALSVYEELNNKNQMAVTLSNIGNLYANEGKEEEAMTNYLRGLKIKIEVGDKKGVAISHYHIGNLLLDMEKYDSAFLYFQRGLTTAEELDLQESIAASLLGIGKVQSQKKEYNKALISLEKGFEIAKKSGILEQIKGSSEALWKLYKILGKHEIALEMHELFMNTRDSIKSEQNERAAIELEYKFSYDKKATEDSILHIKESELRNQIHKAEIQEQRNWQYTLYGGIALILLFSGFIYNRFRVTRKQKEIIQEQKEKVDEVNEELNQTNEEILAQRDAMEEQNSKLEAAHKDIQDSILYAKRIQEAILPSMNTMQESLRDGFVLYNAKAVVAGDFYWLEKHNNKIYFAAADCTGHGVPGAMVSVMCSNALSKALTEEKQTDTNTLLDKTREIVIDRLAKSGDDIRDGMDISIARIDFDSMELQWSGANNPIYLLKKGSKEIEIIKGNKQAVGYSQNPHPFTAHNIKVEKGYKIYLFTDGYADQFGGPKNKKLGYKALRELIVNTSILSMDEQKNKLEQYFNNWKGKEEQIDDVCVIGINIS